MAPTVIFWASAAFIVWVLLGYPLLLHFLARAFGKPIRRRDWTPSVSVLLAVRSGEDQLRKKLETILAQDYPADRMEVFVLSDRGGEGIARVAAEYADRGVRLIQSSGRGKAAALNAGIEAAAGQVLFFTDLRQELDPGSLRALTACLADPDVAVVSGELIIRDAETKEASDVGLYWRYEKWIRKNLSRLDSIHGATGCIYAMKREYAVRLPERTLLDDVHQPLAAFFEGKRVVFEERARAYDYPTDLDAEFKRKVRTLAGVYQVIGEYPRLLGPGNRMWLHFVSHKLGRLLLPFALIAAFASSWFLPEPWRTPTVAAQLAFYALALIDPALPDKFPLKRLTSPARVFVVLMVAAFSAASILFQPNRDFWQETKVAGATDSSS